jgi:hypothetical protein
MPTPEQVDQAMAAMKKLGANYIYFFEKNDSPDWIEPLAAKGFFKHPEPPIDRDDGMRSFPVWPESQYLARMASKAPEQVTQTLLAMPTTPNIFIHGDIVDAARAMPGAQASQLSASERKWMRTQGQLFWLLPQRYADLVVHLAQEGQADEAYELARSLLEVLPDPRWADASDEDKRFMPKEPLARMQQWDYQEAVKKLAPALQAVDPMRTLKLFGGLLQDAMRLAEPPNDEDQSDNSYIWRPAVEDHAQNVPEHSIRDVLVAATRDSALATVAGAHATTQAVVAYLEAQQRSIFRRIALHVLAEHGEAAKDLALSWVADWDSLDDHRVRHEFARLASAYFKDVKEEGKRALLEHFRTPPAMDNFRRNFASLYGREPTEEEVHLAQEGMELKKLTVLKDGLPAEWKARYEELVARHGTPEHPDFSAYSSSGWVGPTSPKTIEELSSMEIPELLEYLRSWKPPSGEMFADTYEGLGRQLAGAVGADPAKFALHALAFAELEPTYARSLVDGLDRALSANKTFDWPPVLDLARSLVIKPPTQHETDDPGGWADRDPGWRWARGSVAHLLGEGFQRTTGEIPIDHRELAWQILEPLTSDPEPDAEHEERFGGTNMDPLTLSINTNRGKAMHAAIRYGLWVRRHDEADHPERVGAGFDAIPELRKVLDAHLDPDRDPSQAIRAVYGERLPWLILLDGKWVSANLDRLFPTDPKLALLRASVWETYLVNAPYDSVFDILEGEYHRAVSEIRELTELTDHRRFVDPAGKLAEHLITLYWRGRVTWDSHGGILQEFFDRAPQKARAHALEFVGRSLWRGQMPLAEDQPERLRELWRRRFEAFAANTESGREEVGEFGWWFASSGKLPDDWLIEGLLRLLEAGVAVEADHLVLERLADLAPANPFEAVRAARLMVKLKPEAHFMLTTNEHLRRIVSAALIADNGKARSEATDLMNELAAKGYRGMDDLAAEL